MLSVGKFTKEVLGKIIVNTNKMVFIYSMPLMMNNQNALVSNTFLRMSYLSCVAYRTLRAVNLTFIEIIV